MDLDLGGFVIDLTGVRNPYPPPYSRYIFSGWAESLAGIPSVRGKEPGKGLPEENP